MKGWIAALLSICLLLTLAACSQKGDTDPSTTAPTVFAPDPIGPGNTTIFGYDITTFGSLAGILDTKSSTEWESMGIYALRLNGLHTPVFVEMSGMNVLSVSAFDQIVDLGSDGVLFQDSTPVNVQSTAEAVIVTISRDYETSTIVINNGQYFKLLPENGISTVISVREDGSVGYRRYWCEYETTFQQNEYAPLDLCSSRDQFLYETGSASVDGGVNLTPENTVTLGEEYDLDALFTQAKAAGLYEAYETVDDWFAAKQTGNPEGEE